MAALLLNLRDVPDDEAGEVRALLDAGAIAWYETPPNRWGISAGAIWLVDAADLARARALLDDYQERRRLAARSLHEGERRAGRAPTFAGTLRTEPLRVAVAIATILLMLGLVLLPVWLLGR
jgi:hypothetical protein